jgi:hypothetical protein
MRSRGFRSLVLVNLLVTGLLIASGCGRKGTLSSLGRDEVPSPPSSELRSFPPSSEPAKEKDLSDAKPDFVLDAKAWSEEWREGLAAARAKYRGKVIDLSGEVDSFVDGAGEPAELRLKAAEGRLGARCLTVDRQPWAKVAPGSKVKIRGMLASHGSTLSPSYIIWAGPNPALLISSQDLAKQFAADREGTAPKFHDKWIYVDGEVVEKMPPKGAAMAVLKLKGEAKEDEPVRVDCIFTGESDRAVERVKVGARVKVLGKAFLRGLPSEKSVHLHECLLIRDGK